MALSHVFENSYLPEENIDKLRSELTAFSDKINEASKKENKGKRYPKEILEYSNAVTKSTTDKDRRLARHKIVLGIVTKYVKRTGGG